MTPLKPRLLRWTQGSTAKLDGVGGIRQSPADSVVTVDDRGYMFDESASSLHLSVLLSLNADGVTFNQNVNGSVTPQLFSAGPPTGVLWNVAIINVIVMDTGLRGDQYGGLGGPITNGVKLDFQYTLPGPTVITASLLPSGRAIKQNYQWYVGGGQNDFFDSATGPEILLAQLPIRSKLRRGTLGLDGNLSAKIICTIQDDLTGLNAQEITLIGTYEPSGRYLAP